MAGDRGRWSTIEHTADLAVEVEASSREELFVAAAEALVGVMKGEEEGGAGAGAGPDAAAAGAGGSADGPDLVWRELELEADDAELLLVDWLGEILYWAIAAEPLFFKATELEALEDKRLRARVGLSNGEEAAQVERELKGVTYHDLELSQRDGGWYARIVFDV